MPTAASLVIRGGGGSQQPSAAQVWLVTERNGTTFTIRFEKEFVKKHLFVDPDPNPTAVKVNNLVAKINHYATNAAAPVEVAPPATGAAEMQYLKMKKLVLARSIQGDCATCHTPDTHHDLVCATCGHLHRKAWANGGLCGAPGCTCTIWVKGRGANPAQGCANFVVNNYETNRAGVGKVNLFGGSGGSAPGINMVILLNTIDRQDFIDSVYDGIISMGAWNIGEKKEHPPVPLDFGQDTVATIMAGDNLAAYTGRAKSRGMLVYARQSQKDVYSIYHYAGIIP